MQIETVADAAAMFRASLPKEQKEERVLMLPLGANGEVLKKPILVSIGTQKGTAEVQLGEVFSEAYKGSCRLQKWSEVLRKSQRRQ